MARVVKAPIVRRAELLDCAQELFFTAGYEATTIADIIARAGVSKGGFYHHFDSKEALFEALIERLIEAVLADVQETLEAPGLDALTRLNTFFAHARHWKIDTAANIRGLMEAALRADNDALYHRVTMAMARVMTPVLTALIEQGMRDGQFNTPDAALTAEVLQHVASSRRAFAAEALRLLDDGDLDGAAACIDQRIVAEEAIFNRLLGLADGGVQLGEPGFTRTLLKRLKRPAETPHASLG